MELAYETAFARLALRVRAGSPHFRRFEDLHAIVAAIAYVQETVVRELRAVNGAAEEVRLHVAGLEIARPRAGAFAHIGSGGVFADYRVLPVRAEMSDVLAARCVDDQHAAVAVTVGYIHEVRLRI